MPEPSLYLMAMGAAVVVSAIFVLAMAGVWRPVSTTRLNSACVLGISLGFLAGCYVLLFRWTWPPRHGLDRLLTIVVPAVLGIELLAGFQHAARRVAWCLRIVLAAVTPSVLLHGSVYVSGSHNGWTLWQSGAALVLCGTLLASAWGLLAWLSARSPGVSIPLALVLAIQCAGLAVMMAGYIKGGAAAFPLAATLAATSLCAWLTAKRSAVPAILGIGVVGLFGLLFIGRFFGRLSTASALAMLLAPLLCWATETPFLRRRKPCLVGSVRLVLVAIPLLAVLAVAKHNFNRDMAPLLGNLDSSCERSAVCAGRLEGHKPQRPGPEKSGRGTWSSDGGRAQLPDATARRLQSWDEYISHNDRVVAGRIRWAGWTGAACVGCRQPNNRFQPEYSADSG